MIARETSTDGHIDLESTCFGVEEEFGCSEGIVLMKLEEPIIKTTFIGIIKSIDAKIKVEEALSLDHNTRYRLFIELKLLFLKPLNSYLLVTTHNIIIWRGDRVEGMQTFCR